MDDALGKGILVGGLVDQLRFERVTHEAAFEQNGRVSDAGEHAEARPFDAAVEGVAPKFLENCPVDGGCKGDVCRVVVVSSLRNLVVRPDSAAIVGYAGRGQGERLDAASGAAAGIEMEADIDRTFADAICEFDAFLERDRLIAVASHDDTEALGLQVAFHEIGEPEIVARLAAKCIGRAWIGAAVAGIKNHRLEIACGAYEIRAENGVDQFLKINGRDEDFFTHFRDRVAEDELHLIHQAFMAADFELQLDLGFSAACPDESDVGPGLSECVELVVAPDAVERDALLTCDFCNFPAAGCCGEKMAQAHDAQCRSECD